MELPDFKSKLDKIFEKLKEDLGSLRTGRATPALVENVSVDCYGTPTPLKAIATISNPEPRQLVIQPWDKSMLPAIEKAIETAALGFTPIADKDRIRVSIPSLTEERRKEMVKFLGRHLEDTRIRVRQIREDALREVDHRAKAKEISEDEKFRKKNEIQKTVDEVNRKIEDAGKTKEKEIMTV